MPNCIEPVALAKGLLRDQQGAWTLPACCGSAWGRQSPIQEISTCKYDTLLALHHKLHGDQSLHEHKIILPQLCLHCLKT